MQLINDPLSCYLDCMQQLIVYSVLLCQREAFHLQHTLQEHEGFIYSCIYELCNNKQQASLRHDLKTSRFLANSALKIKRSKNKMDVFFPLETRLTKATAAFTARAPACAALSVCLCVCVFACLFASTALCGCECFCVCSAHVPQC